MRKLQISTRFHMGEVAALYDNPVKQAEYLYSLIESEKKSQSSESQRTAASVQTAMSRLQVMKLRLSITQNLSKRTLNGNLQAYMLMMVFQVPTLKTVTSLIA